MKNAYRNVEAGRILDAHVHRIAFEKEVTWRPLETKLAPYCKAESDYGFGVQVPEYSRDMTEAWKLVNFMKLVPPEKGVLFIKLLVEQAQFPDGTLHMVGQTIPEATFHDVISNITAVKICRAALETIRTFQAEMKSVHV